MRSPPHEGLRTRQKKYQKQRQKFQIAKKGRNKSVIFEEPYEDFLSYLKIRRLFKAFSIKSDYKV